ncbi:putative disease resistance protein RGA3 [Tasmannia lanceolata]|uniref:putative disease resistance protein RGA3 n=1 Tax=Tasmannia lanceolata TaxID=3420 RepID=UPI0040639DB3
MAVSWLAEKVVSHLLDAVLGNLTQEMKSIWGVGVEEELKKLERKVKVIQEVIEDAEEKQFHSKAVGSWLRELKNIAYDADDVLDDVATEALQLSTLRDQGQTSKRQKRRILCVSDNFDVLRITNAIIESASGSNCGLSNLDAAQRCLREKLNAEKFLIVLDDVWGENQIHNWDRLRAPFRVGAKGSKIIMTTRDERVARMMATIPSHDLQGLPDDDCWELFTRRAFAGRISNAHPELEEIGRQIVKKCNGLPLAVKTLGGILSSKRNVSEWESILTSEIWKDDKSDILPALRLSYRYLPTNQKQCFAYSAAFPKDHRFQKDLLVRRWMAAGFIQPKGRTLLEDIGGEIFDDLLLKSFFQYSSELCGTPFYVMHDLMHDPAESISGDECFRLEDGTSQTIPEMAHHLSWIDINGSMSVEALNKCKRILEHGTSQTIPEMARHLSWTDVKEGSMSLETLKKFKRLRTLRLSIDNQILSDALMELRCLRVLDMRSSKIDKLLDSIGHLKHLRYLDLSYTEIDGLPESVTSLCNLQTLGLESCENLEGLPKGITNLVNLRHIALSWDRWGSISVPGIGKLTSLQTLLKFKVCKESGCQIGELKNMRNIKGRLEISGLEDVQNIEEAKEGNLKDKKYLNELSLKWHRSDSSQDGRVNDDGVLEGLQPHANLKKLRIISYSGVSFPSWMSHLSNLTCITVEDCRNCEHPFPLDCQLPSLCKLTLQNCPKLQTTLPADLPAVTELYINDCGELSALPRLSSIPDLKLYRCGVKMLLSLTTPCLVSLQRLSIGGCDQLECFLEEVSLQDLTSLQHLQIFGCLRLKSL